MAVKRGIQLQCTICKEINYLSRKNAKTNPDRLELIKFCNTCRKATPHKEAKKK